MMVRPKLPGNGHGHHQGWSPSSSSPCRSFLPCRRRPTAKTPGNDPCQFATALLLAPRPDGTVEVMVEDRQGVTVPADGIMAAQAGPGYRRSPASWSPSPAWSPPRHQRQVRSRPHLFSQRSIAPTLLNLTILLFIRALSRLARQRGPGTDPCRRSSGSVHRAAARKVQPGTGRGRAQRYQTSGTPRDIPVGQPQRRLEEHRTHDDPAGMPGQRRAACDPHPHRPRDGVKVRDKVREIADRYPDVDHDGSATRIARTVTGLAGHGPRADWPFAIGQPVTERQTRWRSTVPPLAILNG
mgnify:CR=1 FL=1